jgi:hypothetical protein
MLGQAVLSAANRESSPLSSCHLILGKSMVIFAMLAGLPVEEINVTLP